jgi:hypothetical protein
MSSTTVNARTKEYDYMTLEHHEIHSTQNVLEESATKNFPLGTMLSLADGRKYRYSRAGAVALAAGKTNRVVLDGLEKEDTLTAAVAIGSREVTYTAVATMTEDEYAEGFMVVSDGTGQGYTYKIAGNEAITAGSTGTIYLQDAIVVALDTTTDVFLVKSPYDGVLLAVDDVCMISGVAPRAVTANYYFWNQVRGVAAVLSGDSTGVATTESERFADVAGGVDGAVLGTAGGNVGSPLVGHHIFDSFDATSGDYTPTFLTLE